MDWFEGIFEVNLKMNDGFEDIIDVNLKMNDWMVYDNLKMNEWLEWIFDWFINEWMDLNGLQMCIYKWINVFK